MIRIIYCFFILTFLMASSFAFAENVVTFGFPVVGSAPTNIYIDLNEAYGKRCSVNADCGNGLVCIDKGEGGHSGICQKQARWGYAPASQLNPFAENDSNPIRYHEVKRGSQTVYYFNEPGSGQKIYIKQDIPGKKAGDDPRSVLMSLEDGQYQTIFHGIGKHDVHFFQTYPTYPSGDSQKRFDFKKRLGDGSYKEYFENGELKIETQMVNGKPDGEFKEFYANGKLKRWENWKDGKKEGPAKLYYENGQVQSEFSFENNKQGPFYKLYYEDGKLFAEFNAKDFEIGEDPR